MSNWKNGRVDGRKFSEVLKSGLNGNMDNNARQVKKRAEHQNSQTKEEKMKIVYGVLNPEQIRKMEKCIHNVPEVPRRETTIFFLNILMESPLIFV